MQYNPNEIEPKWQKFWIEDKTFKAENQSEKPKFYVLDMFPYPSGDGQQRISKVVLINKEM